MVSSLFIAEIFLKIFLRVLVLNHFSFHKTTCTEFEFFGWISWKHQWVGIHTYYPNKKQLSGYTAEKSEKQLLETEGCLLFDRFI